MTVRELIEKLGQADPDDVVLALRDEYGEFGPVLGLTVRGDKPGVVYLVTRSPEGGGLREEDDDLDEEDKP
jgi:hypothetical protein